MPYNDDTQQLIVAGLDPQQFYINNGQIIRIADSTPVSLQDARDLQTEQARQASFGTLGTNAEGMLVGTNGQIYYTQQQLAAQAYAQAQYQRQFPAVSTDPNVKTWDLNSGQQIGGASSYTPNSSQNTERLGYSTTAGPNFMSVDAAAYFSDPRNSDLLAAYQANNYGMNPTDWARAHFTNFGQSEGRQWGAAEPVANTTYSNTANNTQYSPVTNNTQYSPVAQPDNSYTIGPPPTWTDSLNTIRQQTDGVTPYNPNTQTTTPWQPTQVMPTPADPTKLANAVDSSAWRAAPTALTALQQGGRGMLYS
jgi:hypothetical protein